MPGVGKTTLTYVFAKSLDCQFNRIQFTIDILPSGILGVSIYKGSDNQFEFFKGPVFSSIVLAEEINRASPKSQYALLEALERGLVTIDGASRPIKPLISRPATTLKTEGVTASIQPLSFGGGCTDT